MLLNKTDCIETEPDTFLCKVSDTKEGYMYCWHANYVDGMSNNLGTFD